MLLLWSLVFCSFFDIMVLILQKILTLLDSLFFQKNLWSIFSESLVIVVPNFSKLQYWCLYGWCPHCPPPSDISAVCRNACEWLTAVFLFHVLSLLERLMIRSDPDMSVKVHIFWECHKSLKKNIQFALRNLKFEASCYELYCFIAVKLGIVMNVKP